MSFAGANQTPVALSNVQVNAANNTVSGQTTHFSYFVLVISTSGGGGGSYPPPSGGNPQGTWNFDHVTYETTMPLPDSIQYDMSADGSGTLVIGATDWELNITENVHIYYAMLFFGNWIVLQDTTITENTHSWGTYTAAGTTMTATTTGSATDPGSIGDVVEFPYTAESNRFIRYDSATEGDYQWNLWTVFTR